MSFKGTQSWDYLSLSKKMDLLGGNFNAFTSKELVTFYGKIIYSNLREALELLFEIAFKPIFPEEEMKKEKKVVLEEIAMAMDQPEEPLLDLYYRTLFNDHPLSLPVIGYRETVERFQREDLASYHFHNFTPDKLIISLCGKLTPQDVIGIVEDLCDNYCSDYQINYKVPVNKRTLLYRYPEPSYNYLKAFRYHPAQEAYVIYGTRGLPQSSRDRFKWVLLDTILGGSNSSKLFVELREKRGLVYSVGTFHQSYALGGTFGVSFVTNPDNLGEALKVTKDVLSDPEILQEEDLEIAKAQVLTSMALSYENSFSRMFANLKSFLYLGRIQTPPEVMREIEAITLKDIRDISSDIASQVQEDAFTLSVVSSRNTLDLPLFQETDSYEEKKE